MKLLMDEKLSIYDADTSSHLSVVVSHDGRVTVWILEDGKLGAVMRSELPTDADAITIAETLGGLLTEAVEKAKAQAAEVA